MVKKGVNINIQKGDLFLVVAIAIFVLAISLVIAYNPAYSGAVPGSRASIMGHTADEIDGNLSSSGGGSLKTSQVTGITDITPNSSWADMPDMTITINTNGGDVLLMFSGNIFASGNDNAAAQLRFKVDAVNRHNMETEAGDGAWQNDFAMNWIEKNLAAGSHTFKVQWYGSKNPSSVHQQGATHPRVFSAIELGGSGGGMSFVAGSVNADGSIRDGTGFSVTKTAAGRYTVNFLTSFSSTPVVTLTGLDLGYGGPYGPNYQVIGRTSSSANIATHCIGTGDCDIPFSFIAIR